MTAVVLALLGQAVVTALAGPRLLRPGGWTDRAPRTGIAVALALAGSVLASVVLAASLLATPLLATPPDAARELPGFVRACFAAVRGAYPHGADADGWPALVGLAVAVGVLGRVTVTAFRVVARSGRVRRRQADGLALLGRGVVVGERDHRVLVVPHDAPLVYCVPARGGTVVVSDAAVRVLGGSLDAVLAHERAHLRGRHHLLVLAATVPDEAVPGIPLLGSALRAVSRLVELAADDAASARHGRRAVATALMSVACGSVPQHALGAGGPTAVARVTRLLRPDRRLPRRTRLLVAALAPVVATAPLLTAAAPLALAPGQGDRCSHQGVAGAVGPARQEGSRAYDLTHPDGPG